DFRPSWRALVCRASRGLSAQPCPLSLHDALPIWIVAYSAAESPVEYYRYDRGGDGRLTRLFSGRPALEGKPLVPMWPLEIASREGRKSTRLNSSHVKISYAVVCLKNKRI